MNIYENRRKKFRSMMKDNSIAVFYSGKAPRKSADAMYDFAVDRSFYYLTGIDREDMVLIITNKPRAAKETLFIPPIDEYYEKRIGHLLRESAAMEISGIQNISDRRDAQDSIFGSISSFYGRADAVYLFYNIVESPYESLGYERILARQIKEQYPDIDIISSLDIIIALRQIKDEYEIAQIKKAIDITKLGLDAIMKGIKPGMYEYQVKAIFTKEIMMNGSDHSFEFIGASGVNAVILHYVELSKRMQDGDMLLLDLGALSNNYASDISRTYPVSGKFTPKQKEIYNIVLEAQQIVFDNMKIGVSMYDVNDMVKAFYAKALKTIKLITQDSQVSDYYYHGIGHSLGLDVHDIRTPDHVLAANMAYTVEPGLYIRELNLGIRIEDDVLVTENGIELLSDNIIKTVDDIEEYMQK